MPITSKPLADPPALRIYLDVEEQLAEDVLAHVTATDSLSGYRVEVVDNDARWDNSDVIVADVRGGPRKWLPYAVVRCSVVALFETPRDVVPLAALHSWGNGAFIPANSAPDEIVDAIVRAHLKNAMLVPAEAWPALRIALATTIPASASLDELTDRQIDVLIAVSDGLSNPEIAARLHITEATVRFHVHSLFTKTGCKSREELIIFAFRSGLGAYAERPPERQD